MCFGNNSSTAVSASTQPTAARAFSVAQALAIQLGKEKRFVNAGMVQERLARAGFSSAELGNAAGSLFSNKNLFRSTGTKVRNTNPSARGRLVTQWEYIGLTTKPIPGSVSTTLVDATEQNTKPGVMIQIRPELREKLTGNGQRPFVGRVVEVNSNSTSRWPIRVEYTNGARGLLTYSEFQVLQ